MENVPKYILNIPELNEGCTLSLSNPSFQSDTVTYKYVTDSSETTPMFLLFQRQHDNRHIYPNSGSQGISGDTAFSDCERTSFNSSVAFPEKAGSFQYDLLLTENAGRDVVISSGSPRRCSDDNGFYSGTEDSVSDIVDINIAKEDMYCTHESQCKPRQEAYVNTEFNKDSCKSMAVDGHQGQDTDSQSIKALLKVSPPTPARTTFKLSCHRPNGTTISLEDDHHTDDHHKDDHHKDVQHWYVVVSRLTMKEKLTRRQLFQIAGMTFLGFIFVGLIIIWVFSPVLF